MNDLVARIHALELKVKARRAAEANSAELDRAHTIFARMLIGRGYTGTGDGILEGGNPAREKYLITEDSPIAARVRAMCAAGYRPPAPPAAAPSTPRAADVEERTTIPQAAPPPEVPSRAGCCHSAGPSTWAVF